LKIRFQADADIDPDIRKGLLRREPAIDFRPAAGTIPEGTLDPDVLRIAAEDDSDTGFWRLTNHEHALPCLRHDARIARSLANSIFAVDRSRDRRAAFGMAELDAQGPAQPGAVAPVTRSSVQAGPVLEPRSNSMGGSAAFF